MFFATNSKGKEYPEKYLSIFLLKHLTLATFVYNKPPKNPRKQKLNSFICLPTRTF